MRTFTLLILSMMFFLLNAQTDSEKDKTESVIINIPIDKVKKDRSTEILLFSAYYYNRYIHLCNNSDSNALITITNNATGDLIEDYCPYNSTIRISLTAPHEGNYSIEIIAENGDVYIGEFQL